MNGICENCEGRFDRPGLHGCNVPAHKKPDLAQKIVAVMECELSDKRGLSWDSVDYETACEMRDTLASTIRETLKRHASEQRLSTKGKP